VPTKNEIIVTNNNEASKRHIGCVRLDMKFFFSSKGTKMLRVEVMRLLHVMLYEQQGHSKTYRRH
jgi:hypothetical protein